MKQYLYMIRHGNTPGIEQNLMYGATDLPVTDEGLRDISMNAAAGIYPDPEGSEIYTSGMLRTEQTCRAIYGDAERRVAPLLREINVGQFEMMSVKDILKDDYGRAWLTGKIDDPSFKGGDSMSGFVARTRRGAREVVEDCAARGIERMILIIHGGVIASIMSQFFPEEYEDIWDWNTEPGSGYEVELDDGKPLGWLVIGDVRGVS